MTLSPADVLYSAARVALFCALRMQTPDMRRVLVEVAVELEAESLLRGAKPSGAALHRISVV